MKICLCIQILRHLILQIFFSGEVKLADFGLSREFGLFENPDRLYTNKVVTLYYRPLELLLGLEKYNKYIDVWSCGCILGELFTGNVMFESHSELDQINSITKICGTPDNEGWPEVMNLRHYRLIEPMKVSRKCKF